MRINKLLSDLGFCSRRRADELIQEGRVTVDGVPATLGTRVPEGASVAVDGKLVRGEDRKRHIALHKPRGIECTADPRVKDNVVRFVGLKERIYPVGRLDKESEGLLFLTNDGAFADFIMRAANFHEKEYVVRVNRPVTEAFLERMRRGVDLEGRLTRPCTVEPLGRDSFSIVLTQGMNRQIRRMCEALGYRVQRLQRVRILSFRLEGLKPGAWRDLTPQELEALYAAGTSKEPQNQAPKGESV